MRLAMLLRYWHTLKYLKPVQLYGRVRFRLLRPTPDLAPAPPRRPSGGPWWPVARRQASLVGPHDFKILGESGALADIGWDGPKRDKLWRYNQHYFDDLNALGSADRMPWHQGLIADWIAGNPVGQGTGWEPYPTALRIVNWVKWALAHDALSDQAVASLAVQVRWLAGRLEWHLLGNHLFANAKALVFAGLFFDGPEAEGWLRLGQCILADQVPEQILSDGGQFELSPMYHALCVEDMLDLVNIAEAFGRAEIAKDWRARLPDMLAWIAAMSHPDGRIAFFNDAALGIAPDNAELVAYAGRFGFMTLEAKDGLLQLGASGYVRMTLEGAVVIADVARVGPDYIPGHAHADTLSFEMSLGPRRLIVNSGTSVYGVSAERLRQRGTAAHSTLVIDGADSSEVWSGFRVARRARPFDVSAAQGADALVATGAHDGYRRLPGRPIHRRAWHLGPGKHLTITDTVTGTGDHHLEASFFLAPGLSAVARTPDSLDIVDDDGRRLARLSSEGGHLDVAAATWHPAFGTSVPNRCIGLTARVSLPHKMSVMIDWGA